MIPAPVSLLGVPVHPVPIGEALALAVQGCARAEGAPFTHVAVNANKLLDALSQPDLLDAVRSASLATADGVGAIVLARRLGTALPGRVTGIDLMEALVAEAARRGWSIYLLGAGRGVAEDAALALAARHEGLIVAGTRAGDWPPGAEDAVAAGVAATGARLLFVALPTPRKELFVSRHAAACGVRFAMGVGGALDVIAGRVRRAPRAVQRLGLEWAWRWAQEPRRLTERYGRGGLRFAALVARGRP